MPSNRVTWPYKGRVDANARGDQPELTTSEAQNVRNYASGTERLQGGQRPGLVKWTSAQPNGSNPIQALNTLVYDRPPFTYSADPADIVAEWETTADTEATVLDVRVDNDGNSYWLLGDGTLQKRNSQGVSQWVEAFPRLGLEIVPRLSLDPFGGFYIGLQPAVSQGGPSKILSLVRTPEDEYSTLRWSIDLLESNITDLKWSAGLLFVGQNDDITQTGEVRVYDGLTGAEPNFVTSYATAWPLRQFDVCRGGIVYQAAPSLDRAITAVVDDDGGSPEIDWTPINLSNYEQRLHFWSDALKYDGLVSGTSSAIEDHRQLWVDYYNTVSSGFVDIIDDTGRSMSRRVNPNTELPVYDPVAINNNPGLRFDPSTGGDYFEGQAQSADLSMYGAECSLLPPRGGTGPWLRTKPDVLSKLPRSLGMWPQSLQHTFAITMLVRCNSDAPQIVYGFNLVGDISTAGKRRGMRNGFVVVANADLPSDGYMMSHYDGSQNGTYKGFGYTQNGSERNPLVSNPGRFMLMPVNRSLNQIGSALTNTDIDGSGFEVGQDTGNSQEAVADPGPNTLKAYLITIVVEWTGSAYNIRLRVNGTESTALTFLPDNFETLYEPQDCFGGQVFRNRHFTDIFGGIDWPGGFYLNTGPFDGWLMEAVTYFADTTAGGAAPHNKTYGDRASGAGSSSNFFLDVEKVEAYMAWHYGVNGSVLVAPSVPGAGTDGNQYTGSAPSGGTGGVSADVSGATIAEQLRSSLGLCAKVSLSTNNHVWAYAGAGFGYSQTVNPENGLIWTLGPKDLGYPLSSGSPIAGDPNWDFAAISRKLRDNGTIATVRRAGYCEVHFYEVPSAGDTIVFRNLAGGIVNTVTFVSGSPGAQEVQVTGSTTLNGLFDDTSAGGFQEKVTDAATGQSPWSALPAGGGKPVFVPASTVPFRTLRIYAQSIAATPDFEVAITGSYGLVRFQMTSGLDGDTGSDDTDAWTFAGDYNAGQPDPDDINARIDHDFENNVFLPSRGNKPGGTKANHIWRVTAAPQSGTPTDIINTVAPYPNSAPSVDVNWKYDINGSAGSDFAVTAVAVRPDELQFYPDEDVGGTAHLWVGNDNINKDGAINNGIWTQHKLNLIKRTPLKANARRLQYLAVVSGAAYRLNDAKTAWDALGTIADTTGAVYTDMVSAFGQMFFVTDGAYYKYDPIRGNDVVEAWTAETAGEMPEGCRLAAFHRGRLVLARSDLDPFRIYASAVGDPYDWDLSPLIESPTAAFGGSNQDQTRNPDIVNALAPFYDDVLLVGGDHSITQFRGDLSALGQIDYFTDVTGMAFGHSWALSPEGLLYFFGSRGGVWVMQPTTDGRAQPPVEITRDTIAEALRKIDLTNYLVRLMWDHDAQGLHVYLTPNQGSVSTANIHYYYEARTKSWWEVTLGTTGLQPVSCALLDGNTPDERQAAIGCNDGYIRRFADSAADDDGTAISSSVLIGPLVAPEAELEQRISALQATLAASGGCNYEVYASDSPVLPVSPQSTGTLAANRNQRVSVRVRGGYVWIRLTNASSAARWALESLFIDLHFAGRRRNRS